MLISYIIKITKTKHPSLIIYNDHLETIKEDVFEDVYTLNFYLQAFLKQSDNSRCIFVIHNIPNNEVKIKYSDGDDIFLV